MTSRLALFRIRRHDLCPYTISLLLCVTFFTAACSGDRDLLREVIWVETARFADEASEEESLLAGPVDLLVQGDRLWVIDYRAADVPLFTLDGRLVHRIGRKGEGPGEFTRPTLFLSWSDSIGVWDFGSNRIQVFDRDGRYSSVFRPGTAEQPSGGAGIGHDGRIYLARGGFQTDHLVHVLNPDGSPLFSFGELPTERVDFLDMVTTKKEIVEGKFPHFIANSIMMTVTNRAVWTAFQTKPVIRQYSMEGKLEVEITLDMLIPFWETAIAAWRQQNAEDAPPWAFYGLKVIDDFLPFPGGDVLLVLDDPEHFSAICIAWDGRVTEWWKGPEGEWRDVAIESTDEIYVIDEDENAIVKLTRLGG